MPFPAHAHAPGIVVPGVGTVDFVAALHSETVGTATSLNIDFSSSGRQSGDFLLIQATHASNGDFNIPDGWTALTASIDSTAHRSRWFYKQSAGTEGVVTLTYVGTTNRLQIEAGVYRGVDWSTGPFGATVQSTTALATTGNPPAVTTVVANERVVSCYSVDSPAGTFPTDAGGPTGFATRINRAHAEGASAGGFADLEEADPSTVVDGDTWQWGGSSDRYIAATFGLRPA